MAILIAQEIMSAVEPGAILLNVCVYEMAFISRMSELAPDPTTPVIVYGIRSDSYVVNDHIHLHVNLHAKRP
ncbi:MAG: hypothetical protein ACKV19_07410 [Verrucomicrobiales bacterium]